VWFEIPFWTAEGAPVLVARRLLSRRYYRLTYSDGIDFVIDQQATAIWVDWPLSASIHDVPSYLLGPVIGIVLRLRGVTSLHASAVEWNGSAIMFAGPQGSGKSTIAGALAAEHWAVLSDDTVAIRRSDGVWTATPGYPRLRLWPDAARELARDRPSLPLLPPGASGSTRRYHLDLSTGACRFVEDPKPIGVVYLLEDATDQASAFGAEPVSPAAALTALTGNTYGWRAVDRGLRAREFDTLAGFVTTVPVRRLIRPPDLGRLRDCCAFVASDLDRILRPRTRPAALSL
jgi:hypothetical protein